MNNEIKISDNSLGQRVATFFVAIVPGCIIIAFALNGSWLFTAAALILFSVYGILLAIFFRYNIFDWDMTIKNKQIELRRLFGRLELHVAKTISIKDLGLFTFFFYVFKITIDNKSYVIKLKRPLSVFTPFMILEKEAERHSKAITQLLEERVPQSA